jgi:hypothetical protein
LSSIDAVDRLCIADATRQRADAIREHQVKIDADAALALRQLERQQRQRDADLDPTGQIWDGSE